MMRIRDINPKVQARIGNRIGQTYSVMPNDSNMIKMNRKVIPKLNMMDRTTLFKTKLLTWIHWFPLFL